MSKTKTVKDLIEKCQRIYSKLFKGYDLDTKKAHIWKLDPKFEHIYV